MQVCSKWRRNRAGQANGSSIQVNDWTEQLSTCTDPIEGNRNTERVSFQRTNGGLTRRLKKTYE